MNEEEEQLLEDQDQNPLEGAPDYEKEQPTGQPMTQEEQPREETAGVRRRCPECEKFVAKDEVTCNTCGTATIAYPAKKRAKGTATKKPKGEGGKVPQRVRPPDVIPSTSPAILERVMKAHRIDEPVLRSIMDLFEVSQLYRQNYGSLLNLLMSQGIRNVTAQEICNQYFEALGPIPQQPQYGPMQGYQGYQGYQPGYQQGYPQYPRQPQDQQGSPEVMMPETNQDGTYKTGRDGQPIMRKMKGPLVFLPPQQQRQQEGYSYPPEPYMIPQPYPVYPPVAAPPAQPQQSTTEAAAAMMGMMVGSLGQLDKMRQGQGNQESNAEKLAQFQVDLQKNNQEFMAGMQANNQALMQSFQEGFQAIVAQFKKEEQQQPTAEQEIAKATRLAEAIGYKRDGGQVVGRTTIDLVEGARKDIHQSVGTLLEKLGPAAVTGKAPDYKVSRTTQERTATIQQLTHNVDQNIEAVKAENALIAATQQWFSEASGQQMQSQQVQPQQVQPQQMQQGYAQPPVMQVSSQPPVQSMTGAPSSGPVGTKAT